MAEGGYHQHSRQVLAEKDTIIVKLRQQGLTRRQVGYQVGMTERGVKERLRMIKKGNNGI